MGLAYGIAEAVMALALIFGPLAAGLLYARMPSLPFQVSLGLLVLTAPLMWWLAPRPAARLQPGSALGQDIDPPPAR